MSPIFQAISAGYSLPHILNFMVKAFPSLAPKIAKAKAAGYSAEQIIDFISKTTEGGPADKRLSQSEIHAQNMQKQSEMTKDILKKAVSIGTSAVALNTVRNIAPSIRNLFGGSGTPPNSPVSPSPGPQPMAGAPIQPTPLAQTSLPQQPITPPTTQLPQINSKDILDQMGLTERIQNLVKAGNKPEGVKAALTMIATPGQKKWLSEQGFKIDDIIDDYISKNPIEIKPENLSRGSSVITPEGDIATVEDMPGKTSKVNIEGKEKVFETDDLIPEPENKDEILDTYEKLISKIPENLRSSLLNWVGYDPDRNILQVKFHNGSSYTYEDIPQEFAEKLKDAEFLAKTSGNNYYGAWEQGESSRGAGISALIRDLQKSYGGKGKEYSAKFREVYSFLGLPERKLREKLKREAQEKRKKRKGNP